MLLEPRRSATGGETHPWRCLWRGLLQITRTTPRRRMILQFSQMRLTLDRTFMAHLVPSRFGEHAL
jgi:hypothetical protein